MAGQPWKRRSVIPDPVAYGAAGIAGAVLWIVARPYAGWAGYGWFALGGSAVAVLLGALCGGRRGIIGFGLVVGPMLIAPSTGSQYNDDTFFFLHYLYLAILGGVFTVGASLEL